MYLKSNSVGRPSQIHFRPRFQRCTVWRRAQRLATIAPELGSHCVFTEGGVIKKVAGGYKVLSEKGKNLGGPYKTKKEAEKRLRQVEFFKHKK